MSLLERRVQLLLEQEQYARVEAEARRSGRSVNAVIRSAIDATLVGSDDARLAALGRFLEATGRPSQEKAQPWSEIKRDLERELDRDAP